MYHELDTARREIASADVQICPQRPPDLSDLAVLAAASSPKLTILQMVTRERLRG
jgi:hypothetical protein